MKQAVEALVDGGKASAGPPLGPALGPLGVNIGQVVSAINEKTKEFEGMKVPIKVTVDPSTRQFDIEVGSPPTSALIIKELGIEKGSGDVKTKVGNLSMDSVAKIAKMKKSNMLAYTLKAAAKEVVGVCGSMGVTIEGKAAKDVQKEIATGTYDEKLKGE